jgi:23S rRNA (adenine2503-C2)-methyltransferase
MTSFVDSAEACASAVDDAVDPRDLSPQDFFSWARARSLSEDSIRRWAGAVVGRGTYQADSIVPSSHIPKRLAHHVRELPSLHLEQHHSSPVDGFQKLLFRTADGLALETVLIPLEKPGAVTVCLSSQVGCVMGCVFCATARMTKRRNLRSWEIIDQFVQARGLVRSQGRRVTGAVFMGMGEPFLNFNNVIKAARWLHFPVEHAISGKAITISTVGLVPEIENFTDLNLPFRLSISIGAASDEKRAKLVPVAARTPVQRVLEAARRHALARKQRINLAYVCIRGENVSESDARMLAELIGDTPIRLDLIDVTDHSGKYFPPTSEELRVFRDALSRYLKQPVVRRYSGGADIRASCGSLAG